MKVQMTILNLDEISIGISLNKGFDNEINSDVRILLISFLLFELAIIWEL